MRLKSPAFVVLNKTGVKLARALVTLVPGASVHGLKGRVPEVDVPFEKTVDHLRMLFSEGRTIIAVLSTGIVVRALGPLLMDKAQEPPVLVISEDGQSVIPLLGGHSGANNLANILSKILKVKPSTTTAGDTRYGVALDSPPVGWRVVNRDAAKPIMAALLNNEAVSIQDETLNSVDKRWLADFDFVESGGAAQEVRVTYSNLQEKSNNLILAPGVLALGIGCERGASLGDLATFLSLIFKKYNLSEQAVACIATIDIKEDEGAIRAIADLWQVPVRLFEAAVLEKETYRVSDPSDYVFTTVGSHSVSEASALAAAGPDARLIMPKQKNKGITCAVALSQRIINPEKIGRGCGRLAVIGIGPGSNDWRAPEATNEISRATEVIGYKLYLDLLGPLIRGKNRYDYSLGEERDRVAEALRLAAEGKEVALISSGDPGIYAMACLVFELIEHGPLGNVKPEWQRIDVHVVPGISALQAAAARIGAPLGHDFCTISLSDLLTPWEVIEGRLKAAAVGDFVIALYNPVSIKRREQIGFARDILLKYRPAETPVVLAKNLGREEEKIDVITLSDLNFEKVDMLTVVLIGSSQTQLMELNSGKKYVYTPRGYGDKKENF
jgi:cobalt-precorrin 5A hydrolase/precorrin-3B C17-methyltransferase